MKKYEIEIRGNSFKVTEEEIDDLTSQIKIINEIRKRKKDLIKHFRLSTSGE
jgi:hypothetical protein